MNTTTSLSNLTAKQLRQAADIKERIDTLQREMARVLGSSAQASNGAGSQRKTTMSPAVRARIAAAARARWARIKGMRASANPTPKPIRKMSAAARARLAAIAKVRWKKARAAGRTAL